jgi:hypothetical protein
VKGVHERLTFVIYYDEENPWEAKEKRESIQDKKRGRTGFLGLIVNPIEPEHLG